MDTSRWSRLNSLVRLLETRQLFYKKYAYKIVYSINGAYLLSNCASEETLVDKASRSRPRKPIDLKTLKDFFRVLTEKKQYIRTRCEGNSVSIFSQDLDLLYEIAGKELKQYTCQLSTVSLVRSPDDFEVLNQNKIISRTSQTHPWKISLRQGWARDNDNKVALAQYLKALGDEVRVTDFLLDTLSKNNKYISGHYFYVRHPGTADFILMMSPRLIASITEIVVVP